MINLVTAVARRTPAAGRLPGPRTGGSGCAGRPRAAPAAAGGLRTAAAGFGCPCSTLRAVALTRVEVSPKVNMGMYADQSEI